jgi:chloramphenicol-sensitive protein RarD
MADRSDTEAPNPHSADQPSANLHTANQASARRGAAFGVAAYGIWGLFPLYWPLLAPTPALQILAHRMVWSLVFIIGVLAYKRNFGFIAQLRHDRRRVGLLSLAAVLITINWGVYIWGVNSGHVIETSLGYFVNPLVSIALGVVVLHERLRRVQWIAVAIGAVAVLIIAVDYGRLPWIALTLAFSFGGYGLVKKIAATPAVESLAIETSVMAPFAIAYLVAMQLRGTGSFGHVAAGTDALLVACGAVTAIPLLLFAGATRRVPLSVMGLMQFITPVLQFLVGVYVRHEPLPTSELIGFLLVWVALLVLCGSQLSQFAKGRSAMRGRRNSDPAIPALPALPADDPVLSP